MLAVSLDANVCDNAAKAPACMLFLCVLLQMVESEQDSDVDTGFYSDDEEAPPQKRRSLFVWFHSVQIKADPNERKKNDGAEPEM